MHEVFTSNYATIHVADELLRLKGVSDAKVINARDYSMRIWLRPDKMSQLGIGTNDIVQSIKEQSEEDYPIGESRTGPYKEPCFFDDARDSTGSS